MYTPVSPEPPLSGATATPRRARPSSAAGLGGCQALIGALLLAAFIYGTVSSDLQPLRPTQLAIGLLLGLYLSSWLAAGIGLLRGRAWAWWLSGFIIVIAFIRQLLGALIFFQDASLSALLQDQLQANMALLTAIQPLIVAAPLLAWQSKVVRDWCCVRTPLLRAAGLVGAAALIAYSAFALSLLA
jgi:hypothetical protein